MRLLLLTVTASAGLALIFLPTFPSTPITVTTPASVRWAADALDLTEVVHGRRLTGTAGDTAGAAAVEPGRW